MRVTNYTLILLWFFSTLTFAAQYYPPDLQDEIRNGLRDEALRTRLHTVISQGQVILGYREARKIMFGRLHLLHTKSGYAVKDVYCQITYTENDFSKNPPGPDKIPDGSLINTEHSWPQSRFSRQFSKEMQKSDLHILFPANSRANTSRNNLELAEVSTKLSSPCAGAERGYSSRGGNTQYFEPPAVQRGDSARAILYFAVRYKVKISPVEEESLKKWSQQDPVDDFERSRNEQIYTHQHNRNPFVDMPELVDKIADF